MDNLSTNRKYNEELNTFMSIAPPIHLQSAIQPIWKTLHEILKKLVLEHRDADKRNAAGTRISEEDKESSVLLDDIINRMDEVSESRRTEKEEKT